MIKINQQKLSLTKVSIIAKDIASASENGLNLNDHELFQLRSHLKMNMLRDHMKEYLSKDFEIPLPENIVSALKTSGLKTLMNGSAFGDVDLGNINEVDPPHSTTL